MALANAMVVDYGAPHEQSLQLGLTVDAATLGVPGLRLMSWVVAGWGADGGGGARANGAGSPLYDLYWKGGQPVHGAHREVGVFPSYVVQAGWWKGTQVSIFALQHLASPSYADSSIHEVKLTIDVPLTAF